MPHAGMAHVKKTTRKPPTAFLESCGTQLVSVRGDFFKLRGLCLQRRPVWKIKPREGRVFSWEVKLPGDKRSLEKHETTGPKAEH